MSASIYGLVPAAMLSIGPCDMSAPSGENNVTVTSHYNLTTFHLHFIYIYTQKKCWLWVLDTYDICIRQGNILCIGQVVRCEKLRDGGLEIELKDESGAEKAMKAITFTYTVRVPGGKQFIFGPRARLSR